jgi:hypothetical protein
MSDHKESGSTRSQSASISSTDSSKLDPPGSFLNLTKTAASSSENQPSSEVVTVFLSVYHSDDASNYGEPSVENEHEPDAIQEVRNGIVRKQPTSFGS